MTGKERMLTALRFEEPDRPPHWESMFEVEHEAFGLRFPDRQAWASMTAGEKRAAIEVCLGVYQRIIERYRWDALMVYWPWSDPDGVRAAVNRFGDQILVGGVVGGGVWALEAISDWTQFAVDLIDRPDALHERAEAMCQGALTRIDALVAAGAEFIFLPHDVAFNSGPFISPAQFAELVTPYWRRLVQRVKSHGRIAIIHTDGQVMPILDDLLSLGADCLHSLDPLAGVDIAEVKRLTYGKLALMGNVQCDLLQAGPPEAIERSARYCLDHAAPGGGYIFATSNTVFPGMPLANYEHMLAVFRQWCAERG